MQLQEVALDPKNTLSRFYILCYLLLLVETAKTLCNGVLHVLQVVYSHLDDPQGQDIQRGVSYLKLRPGAHTLPVQR